MVSDYWLVKRQKIDVPSLYRRRARYRHNHAGVNWCAAVASIISVVPNCPGLAKAVNPKINISNGIQHIYDMNYLWGFTGALLVYWVANYFFPASETLLKASIYDDYVEDTDAEQNQEIGSGPATIVVLQGRKVRDDAARTREVVQSNRISRRRRSAAPEKCNQPFLPVKDVEHVTSCFVKHLMLLLARPREM